MRDLLFRSMTIVRPSLFRLLVLPAWLLVCALQAQVDSSLTKEFAGLSAKERSRLARKEAEEAAQDGAFQAKMREAEAQFTARHYEEALARYEEARHMRPLNVYPKVKIQDLQALIAQRNAQAVREQAVPEPTSVPVVVEQPIPEPPPPSVVRIPDPVPPPVVRPSPRDSVVPSPVRQEDPPRPEPRPVEGPSDPRPPPRDTVPPVKNPAPVLADGLHERTYKEGNAVVLERRLVQQGRETVYRRVNHSWGAVVYFEDGLAIPARRWAEVFGGQ